MRASMVFGAGLALSVFANASIPGLNPSLIHQLEGQEGGIQDRHAVVGEQPPDVETTPLEPLEHSLAPRQAGNNNNNNNGGNSCECKTKCPSKHFVISTKNCSRCVRCPNDKVADPKSNWRRCVPDRGQHDRDTKSRREEKERKWPEKKKQRTQKFKDGADDRKDKNDKRKAKRMSMCVPIAILGIEEAILANNYVDGFFSEEYLESGDILEYWPEGLTIKEWELDTWEESQEEGFYQGDYLDAWIDYAAENWNVEVERRGMDVDPAPAASRHRQRGLEKRRFGFAGIIRGVTQRIAQRAAERFSAQIKLNFKGFFQTRAGGAVGKGKSKSEQGRAVQFLLDRGPLRWCLGRRTPGNHS